MYYEINVARDGKHFFATAPRSITYIKDLQVKLKVFVEKFPESEGYSINIHEVPEISYGKSIEEVFNYI